MRHTPLLIVLLAAGTLPAADFVVLDNGHRINGVIDETATDNPDQVSIKTTNGVIRIPKSRVKDESLSYETRRAKLKAGDLKGTTELAHWCRSKGKNQEAMELLEIAMAMPGVGLRDKALYARLVDEIKGPEEAYPLYQAYRQDGGKDADTLARLAQLEKAKGEAENTDASTAAPVVADKTGGAPAPAVPKIIPNSRDGLESKGWEAESATYSNQVTPKIIDLTNSDGAFHGLEIAFKSGKMDKAAVRLIRRLSLTDTPVLTFWVQNPGDKPVSLAVAAKTGDKWDFFESPLQSVKSGDAQQLKFDLKGSNFKSQETHWANTGKINNLDDVKELQLLIYNGHTDGSLIVYNMGFPTNQDM